MAELKGYSRYFRFVSAEYDLRWNPNTGKRWAIDSDLSAQYKVDERYKAYQEALLSLLSYDEEYDSSTPLDILEKARSLKHHYFPEWWTEAINASFEALYQDSQMTVPDNWYEALRRNAFFPDIAGEVKFYGVRQWQDLLHSSKQLLFLPDARVSFPHDLLTWIFPFCQDYQITILVKNGEDPFTVSESFARACLEIAGLDPSCVTFLYDRESSIGIRHPDIIDSVCEQGGGIVSKGVRNYFSLFRHPLPFLFSVNSREDIGRGILQKAYSPSQPESLSAIVGYQICPFPQHVSITGQDFNTLSLTEFLKGQKPKRISQYLKQKKKDAETISFLYPVKEKDKDSTALIQHHSGFFRLVPPEEQNRRAEKHAQYGVVRVDKPGDNHVYLQGILFDSSEFAISPLRFDRLTLPETFSVQEPAILSNFSYFFTENLLRMYNESVPPEETLRMVDFPFDYRGEYRDGTFFETVPLYRKGYFGSSDDGKLFIGYLSVEEVLCDIQGATMTIPCQAINPGLREDLTADTHALQRPHPVRLFTPAYPERRIGKGSFNMVVINERIVHIFSDRDVTIPPVGVVLCLDPSLFKPKFSQMSKGTSITWRVRFREEALLRKSTLRWLYGGYNILVLNGENLAATPDKFERTLRKEGWYLSQSMRTQETQLQDGKRHPRLLLGTTTQGKILLLAISGRTHISCGATHTESVFYCQHLLKPHDRLVNLINLDGGASVFLEARQSGKTALLNFPAPSDLNPAGVIRPNVAVLKIARTIREEKVKN